MRLTAVWDGRDAGGGLHKRLGKQDALFSGSTSGVGPRTAVQRCRQVLYVDVQ